MAKKSVQKTLDVHVKGHKRSDPRINKKVDVSPYNREQKVKQFIKSTDPVKELYAKTSDNEKKVIMMKALTKEAQGLIDALDGKISENSKRLESVLKNVSPQDRKIILEEIQKRKIIDAFKELIIEKGEKNPEMLKELLSVDEVGLAWFDRADQTRIKLLQDFYKNQSKPKENKYYDHNEYTNARTGVITLRDFIKEDTIERDRAIKIGESKERIQYLDKKLGEKHILLLKAIEKRNRINKLPRGSIADTIAENKKAELNRKKLEWDSTINYMASPEAFEEYNKGKHAIYRGKETKAFIDWKKEHEKLR